VPGPGGTAGRLEDCHHRALQRYPQPQSVSLHECYSPGIDQPFSVSTALFSACGMSVWVFLLSAVVSLPKQLATVIFGWALKQSNGCECLPALVFWHRF
jgi:hypothetical protein